MPFQGKVTIYDWPDSQLCLDCINSIQLSPSQDGNDIYIFPAIMCFEATEDNDGEKCPFYQKNKGEE